MNQAQQERVDAIHRGVIALTPVQSSQIAAVGHDPATGTLAVQFHPRKERNEVEGPVYHYAGIDAPYFQEFQNSKSLGTFLHQNIKPDTERFPYVKVKEPVLVAGTEQQAAA